jgi:hypothetical protein
VSTEDALWELLSQATVRIADNNDQVRGSGFFVEPKLVLTAAHVVAEAATPLSLVLHDGRRCRIVNVVDALPAQRIPGRAVWPLPDLAVLTVHDEWLDGVVPFVEMSEHTPDRELLISGTAMGLTGVVADVAHASISSP